MEQLKTLGRELAMGSHGGTWVGGQSKEFLDLVKSIGEARSKAEEDRIVLSEIETLKLRLTEPDTPKRKMKEYIIRLVYVEMLGHDASFGYIHAVKMTHDDSLLLKRTGYLAVTLFLREDHDLIILIINTIQKDLKSDNYLVVCAALTAVCKLINEETIPAVLPQVVELIGHPKESIRKKAIMALHRFHQRSAYTVTHLISNFRKRLCDNDPGVMGATLYPLFDIITVDTNSYKDLVASFVNILKQVAERRLSRSYDHHQMPAPFIQIKLLKILSLLGSGDKQASESMYNVVGEVFRKCDSSSNIGNAVLYECICCVSSIYPNPKLLQTAADAISRFLKSDSHNLKYMGIDALGRLIKISPEYAEKNQLAVIDCLEDPDDTLKRKTFELLFKMTMFANVEVIVDRMIEYMVNISDDHYKREITSRCVELAEQFAPHNNWFIQTMNKVFQHAGDLVNIKVAHNLMSLIAEGSGEDEDTHLRSFAVDSYLRIIGEPKLPSTFLQVICWVLGEYGTTDGKFSASFISGKLCDLAEAHATDDTVKAYAVTALLKIYAFELASGRKVNMLPECESFIEELSASHSTDLQQRAYELQALVGLDGSAIKEIMPFNSSGNDIEIDRGLSFLDSYVQESMEKGAQPYIPEDKRSNSVSMHNIQTQDRHESSSMHTLRFEAYELPKPLVPSEALPSSITSTSNIIPLSEPSFSSEVREASSSSNQPGIRLRLEGIQKKWGRTNHSPSEVPVSNPKTTNGILPAQGLGSAGTKPKEYMFSEPEIHSEKQKLAASLFGGSSKSQERKPPAEKKKSGLQPPPDLLDLGDPIRPENFRPVDPFIQLEGLLDVEALSSVAADVPDVMSGACVNTAGGGGQKGPNTENSLARDAVARQAGVIPSGQNPNLFKDLLG